MGWLAASPCVHARRPSVPRPAVNAPDATTVRQLLAAAPDELATFLRLAATTGMRRGELCGLRWSDVDLDAAIVTIRRAVVHDDRTREPVAKSTKTHSRQVHLDPATVAVLRTHSATMAARALAAGATAADGYVFADQPPYSVPWRPDTVTAWFRRLCAELDIEGVRLHDLRHAVATSLLAAGLPAADVAAQLGHSSARTTLGVYAHAGASRAEQAAAIMGAVLDGTG